MPLISDSLAREHLRIDDADEPISIYTRAAELWAAEYLDRNIYEDQTALDAAVADGTAGSDPIVINDLIRMGILLLLGHLYANREEVVVGETMVQVPMGVTRLLHPYRKGLGV